MFTETIQRATTQEMLDLIDETIAYYGADPEGRRAERDGACLYRTADDRRCAVGRIMTDETLDRLVRDGHLRSTIDRVCLKLNPEELRKWDISFLQGLQLIHDDALNWARKGLTSEGAQDAEALRERVRAGEYDRTPG